MAMTYETGSKIKALSPVLDEHAEWYGRVVARAFYPEAHADQPALAFPEGFGEWATDVREKEALDADVLERLQTQHDELHEAAKMLMEVGKARDGQPEIKVFEDFSHRYEQFVLWLHRVERESMQAESGLDPATGLRTKEAMKVDLAKEMERRSRQGKPFSVALARIDHYDRISKVQSEEERKHMIETIAGLVKKCIRSFDDAYRPEGSEFILSLKQASLTGGNAVIERLRRMLAEEGLTVTDEGKEFPVTMSFCIAEPAPGDDVYTLIDNMKADLNRYEDEGGGNTALEYIELSPLRRFIEELEDGPSGHA